MTKCGCGCGAVPDGDGSSNFGTLRSSPSQVLEQSNIHEQVAHTDCPTYSLVLSRYHSHFLDGDPTCPLISASHPLSPPISKVPVSRRRTSALTASAIAPFRSKNLSSGTDWLASGLELVLISCAGFAGLYVELLMTFGRCSV